MNTKEPAAQVILLADDDPDDRLLVKDAVVESGWTGDLRAVENGEELLEYLQQRGRYQAPGAAPTPALILLDINMPRKDGREALREIRNDPGLRRIPVVVLTTSNAESDITRMYDLGANSFISKPVAFDGLLAVIQMLRGYWFQMVELPVAR